MKQYSCDETRRWRDALADGEAPPEELAALERHLSGCEECCNAVKETRRLRAQLRQAALSQAVPPGLETRIRASLHGRPFWAAPWAQFAGAAAALVVVTAGLWAVTLRPMNAVLQAGRGSHVHCTIERKDPPPGRLQRPLPERHQGLPQAVAAVLPAEYHLTESHFCRNQGRVFTHLVYARGAQRLSVIVTDKRSGERLPLPELLSRMRASGIAVYTSAAAGLETAAIETPRGWGYVVSDTSDAENLQAMRLVAASIVQADR